MKYLKLGILSAFSLTLREVTCRSDCILKNKATFHPRSRNFIAETYRCKNVLNKNGQKNSLFRGLRAGGQLPQLSNKSAVAYGMLLALNSGVVNGVCLSGLLSSDGTKQASAAVTGAWTNSALGAATGNNDQFLFNTKCILSYLFGSFLSGMINPYPKPFEVCVSSFRFAFLVGSVLLYASSALSDQPSRSFIFLAAIANGIQNSLTSTTTANLCRSAHFSGCTSDMGTFLGQIVRGNTQNLSKLKVFFLLAMSFWMGGFTSFSLAKTFGKQTLLLNASLYLLLSIGVGFL